MTPGSRTSPSSTSDGGADLDHLLTSALGLFTLIVTGYLFLRPARLRARLGAADAGRIRGLPARHGDRDSLGYLALRTDKSVIWSPSGKACVCYPRVALAALEAEAFLSWPGLEVRRYAWRITHRIRSGRHR